MRFDFDNPPVINPNADETSLEAKRPDIDYGTRSWGPARYFDRGFAEQEWEQMWTKAWLIAGVSSDLRKPGSYFTFNVGRESIVCVRTKEGNVNAFYNVCPHRGNRIVLNDRGRQPSFTCAYHSWSFDHNGDALIITDRESFRPGVLEPCPTLSKVHCEEFAGLVFISMNDDPPPLKEAIGLPEGYLETYEIDQLIVARHVNSEWAANWKIGVDAFYESYHLHAVHPETQEMMGDLNVQYDVYDNGASRMIVPLAQVSPRQEDQTTVNEALKYMLEAAGIDAEHFDGNASDVRQAIADKKRAWAEENGVDYSRFTDFQLVDSWATGIFPNVQIGCHAEGVFLMRFLPHPTDPERFYYDNITMVRPAGARTAPPPGWFGVPEDTDLSGKTRPDCEYVPLGESPDLGLVLDQDAALLPFQQQGVKSRGFKGTLYSEQEIRLRHFHAELDRYINGEK